MSYNLTFKEVNGSLTFTVPLIEISIHKNESGGDGVTSFTLYSDSSHWLSQITNRPSYDELPEEGSIDRTYKCIEKPKFELRIRFIRTRSEAGYNRCAILGSFRYNNQYTGLNAGEEYPYPMWNYDTHGESSYGGKQILAFDREKKVFVSMTTGYSIYKANYYKPGETGIYRYENILINPVFIKAGYYKFTKTYIGNEEITGGDNQIITAPFGSLMKEREVLYLNKNLWDDFWNGEEPPKYPNAFNPDSDDPNADDPEGEDYDPTNPTPSPADTTSDSIPIPTKPTVDSTGTGFITMYNPSAIDIRNLAYFMWSGDFTDLLKKMFSAPFDCLIGLKLLYAPVTTGSSQNIWLGNVETSVSAPKITDQFTDFDCGTITIEEYYASFLDYSPYTKITIFLPFIGYSELNVDEVMNAQLHLTYRIDAYTGACIAFLQVTKQIGTTNLNSVLYEFDGNAAMNLPFTSGDMTRYVSAILNTAASTAGFVAKDVSSMLYPETEGGIPPKTAKIGNIPLPKLGLSNLGNGSAQLVAGKPHIMRGGSLAGANSSMALKQAYVIIERPMQQMPLDYANFIGIPLNMTKTLSQMKGFTVVSQVFMADSQATDEELEMIDNLLRQGVIL